MSNQEFLCIGGPLDGLTVGYSGLSQIEAAIPEDLASSWGLDSRTYRYDVLKTSYRIHRVRMDLPGLSVSGTVYLWNHAKDSDVQIMAKIVASLVDTRRGEAGK